MMAGKTHKQTPTAGHAENARALRAIGITAMFLRPPLKTGATAHDVIAKSRPGTSIRDTGF